MNNNQLKRIDALKHVLHILAGFNPDGTDFNKLVTFINEVTTDINDAKKVLEEQMTFIDEMKKQCEKVDYYNDYLDYIETNIPETTHGIQGLRIEDNLENQDYERNQQFTSQNGSSQKTGFDNQILKASTYSNAAKPVANVRINYEIGFKGLKSLSSKEFDSVHKYMRGRLTVESINSFIDLLNSVLKKKYDIMKQPKNNLKKAEKELYMKWKSLEKIAALPTGTYFCTAGDFVKLEHHKLDKSSFSKLVILRHTKHIKEERCGSETLYIVTSNH